MNKSTKSISKFLSLVLRHKPETINLQLDQHGWADVDELIQQCNKHNKHLDMELLLEVVETNDKKRFALNANQTKIRANQGHSISIDLGLNEEKPKTILYHGTVEKFLNSIQKTGLEKRSRQHVHLSQNQETAIKVGSRRGKPIILTVDAPQMLVDGYTFYLSNNGVWLTDHVPAKYIKF